MNSTASACRDEISPDQAGEVQDEDKDDAAEPDPPPPIAGNVASEDSVELAERPEDLSGSNVKRSLPSKPGGAGQLESESRGRELESRNLNMKSETTGRKFNTTPQGTRMLESSASVTGRQYPATARGEISRNSREPLEQTENHHESKYPDTGLDNQIAESLGEVRPPDPRNPSMIVLPPNHAVNNHSRGVPRDGYTIPSYVPYQYQSLHGPYPYPHNAGPPGTLHNVSGSPPMLAFAPSGVLVGHPPYAVSAVGRVPGFGQTHMIRMPAHYGGNPGLSSMPGGYEIQSLKGANGQMAALPGSWPNALEASTPEALSSALRNVSVLQSTGNLPLRETPNASDALQNRIFVNSNDDPRETRNSETSSKIGKSHVHSAEDDSSAPEASARQEALGVEAGRTDDGSDKPRILPSNVVPSSDVSVSSGDLAPPRRGPPRRTAAAEEEADADSRESDSTSNAYNDIGLVVAKTKELEKILKDLFGATGNGLNELLSSLKADGRIDRRTQMRIRWIANMRNKLVHSVDTNNLVMPNTFGDQARVEFKATVRDLETRLRECAAMERTELDLSEPRGPPDAATYTIGNHPALRGLTGAAEREADEDETGLTYRREGAIKDDPRLLPLDGKGARKAHRRKLSATVRAPDLKDEALFPDIDFAASVAVLQPRRGVPPSGASAVVGLISGGDPAEAEDEEDEEDEEDAWAETRLLPGSTPRDSRERLEEAEVISGRGVSRKLGQEGTAASVAATTHRMSGVYRVWDPMHRNPVSAWSNISAVKEKKGAVPETVPRNASAKGQPSMEDRLAALRLGHERLPGLSLEEYEERLLRIAMRESAAESRRAYEEKYGTQEERQARHESQAQAGVKAMTKEGKLDQEEHLQLEEVLKASLLDKAPGSLGAGETDDRDVIAAIEASKREGAIGNEDEDVLIAMAESMKQHEEMQNRRREPALSPFRRPPASPRLVHHAQAEPTRSSSLTARRLDGASETEFMSPLQAARRTSFRADASPNRAAPSHASSAPSSPRPTRSMRSCSPYQRVPADVSENASGMGRQRSLSQTLRRSESEGFVERSRVRHGVRHKKSPFPASPARAPAAPAVHRRISAEATHGVPAERHTPERVRRRSAPVAGNGGGVPPKHDSLGVSLPEDLSTPGVAMSDPLHYGFGGESRGTGFPASASFKRVPGPTSSGRDQRPQLADWAQPLPSPGGPPGARRGTAVAGGDDLGVSTLPVAQLQSPSVPRYMVSQQPHEVAPEDARRVVPRITGSIPRTLPQNVPNVVLNPQGQATVAGEAARVPAHEGGIGASAMVRLEGDGLSQRSEGGNGGALPHGAAGKDRSSRDGAAGEVSEAVGAVPTVEAGVRETTRWREDRELEEALEASKLELDRQKSRQSNQDADDGDGDGDGDGDKQQEEKELLAAIEASKKAEMERQREERDAKAAMDIAMKISVVDLGKGDSVPELELLRLASPVAMPPSQPEMDLAPASLEDLDAEPNPFLRPGVPEEALFSNRGEDGREVVSGTASDPEIIEQPPLEASASPSTLEEAAVDPEGGSACDGSASPGKAASAESERHHAFSEDEGRRGGEGFSVHLNPVDSGRGNPIAVDPDSSDRAVAAMPAVESSSRPLEGGGHVAGGVKSALMGSDESRKSGGVASGALPATPDELLVVGRPRGSSGALREAERLGDGFDMAGGQRDGVGHAGDTGDALHQSGVGGVEGGGDANGDDDELSRVLEQSRREAEEQAAAAAVAMGQTNDSQGSVGDDEVMARAIAESIREQERRDAEQQEYQRAMEAFLESHSFSP